MSTLNEKNEMDRAIARGQEIARGGTPKNLCPDNAEWGRELVVGFRDCGFLILPLIDGHTPESLVTDVFLMKKYFGDETVIQTHFERVRAYHVGKPAALLAIVTDEQESNYAIYDGKIDRGNPQAG